MRSMGLFHAVFMLLLTLWTSIAVADPVVSSPLPPHATPAVPTVEAVHGEEHRAFFQTELSRNRMYDPSTGRFLSMDPLGMVNGSNMYGYCGGDPVNNADPMGTYWKAILLGIKQVQTPKPHFELDITWTWIPEGPDDKTTALDQFNKRGGQFYSDDPLPVEAATYFLKGYDVKTNRFYRWEYSPDARWTRPIDEKVADPMLSRSEKGTVAFNIAGRSSVARAKQFGKDTVKGAAEWLIGEGIIKGAQAIYELGETGLIARRVAGGVDAIPEGTSNVAEKTTFEAAEAGTQWSLEHLSSSSRQYTENLVGKLEKQFIAAGGKIETTDRILMLENASSASGDGMVTAVGYYQPGKIPKIFLGRGSTLGTKAEELLHWLRRTKGLPGHPLTVVPNAVRPLDPIRDVMEAWGFLRATK